MSWKLKHSAKLADLTNGDRVIFVCTEFSIFIPSGNNNFAKEHLSLADKLIHVLCNDFRNSEASFTHISNSYFSVLVSDKEHFKLAISGTSSLT